MVRAAAKNHASVAIVTSPRGIPAGCSAALGAGGFTLAERQRLAAEAFVHTASYDNAVASWMGNVVADTTDGTGFPAWTGATWDRGRAAALRREPAPGRGPLPALAPRHRPGRAAARQGDVLQQLRRRGRGRARGPRPRRPADGRDHQARQPVRHRRRRDAGGGLRQGARVRPPVGLRRHHRDEPDRDRRPGEHTKGVFTEVIVAPDFEDDALELLRAARTSGCCACRRTWSGSATRSRSARSAAASSCRPRTGSTRWSATRPASRPAATTWPTGGSSPGRRPTRRPWPTSPSPGGRSAR